MLVHVDLVKADFQSDGGNLRRNREADFGVNTM